MLWKEIHKKFRKDIDLQSQEIYVDQTYKFEEIVQLVCTTQIGDIEQGMVLNLFAKRWN